jgi:hypothetical protein
VEVAVNESRHQGAAFPINNTGTCAYPFLDSQLIANIDDMFPSDCDRLCRGMLSIRGEDVCIGDYQISNCGYGNLRLIRWDAVF